MRFISRCSVKNGWISLPRRMPTRRPLLFQGMRSLIAMVSLLRSKRLPPHEVRRAEAEFLTVKMLRPGQAALASICWTFEPDEPAIENPTRFHCLRDLANQFDLEQTVVESRSLDLDIVRQI